MTEILTPVRRLVMGDAFKPNTTDAKGNPLVTKFGPNAGQSRVEYHVAIAIEKTNPDYLAFRATIDQVARAAFPQCCLSNTHLRI